MDFSLRLRDCLLVLLVAMLMACSAPEKASRDIPTEVVLQGYAVVDGVVAQLMDRRATDSAAPCSEIPCYAMIVVEKVHSKGGPAFNALFEGDRIGIFFRYGTGRSSRQHFPDLEYKYPGFKEGDRLRLKLMNVLPIQGDSIRYMADHYQKLKH